MELARAWPEVVALVSLAAVLMFAMVQPWGLPEAALAVPAAGLLIGLGVVTPAAGLAQLALLGPTVGFLAAILVLAHLADVEGVFAWLGARLACASGGRAQRLLVLVFVAASVTTAVLSLDATVVLLTPVVFATATRLRLRARPHVYACTHLANSASTLLPVSNLTNLLAFAASGLSFAGFAALMSLPWLAAIGVEYLVFRLFFRTDLTGVGRRPGARSSADPRLVDPDRGGQGGVDERPGTSGRQTPVVAFVVLAATLAGFGVSGLVGIEPVWVAVAGAAVLSVRAFAGRRVGMGALVRAASPLFCLFVFALGVVVTGVSAHGLGHALATILPTDPTLPNLLMVAAVAAVLANVVNNLPATLVMIAALGTAQAAAATNGAPTGGAAHAGLVLAMLIGVNIGPNLTYVGSLATLLWRRVLAGGDAAPTLAEFGRLGALTVPLSLLTATLMLWVGATLGLR